MAEELLSGPFPDLKELENKVGRKTPESLLVLIRDAAVCEDSRRSYDSHDFSSTLSDDISKLKQEMTSLRSADVRILRQLVALHEGIEAMHWLMEERGSMNSLLEEDDLQHGSWTSPRWSSKSRYRESLGSAFTETTREKPVDQKHLGANPDDSSNFESPEPGPSSLFSSSFSHSAHDHQGETLVSAADSPVSADVAASLKQMPDPARLRNIKTGAETIRKALLRCGKLSKPLKVETGLTQVSKKKSEEQQTEETLTFPQNISAAKDKSSAGDPSLSYNTCWYWTESNDDVTNL